MRLLCGTLGLFIGTLAIAAPAAAFGPDRWVRAHHHSVHGKPRSIFVDPVGYAFPAIKNREVKSGYRPLPDLTPNILRRSTLIAPQPKL